MSRSSEIIRIRISHRHTTAYTYAGAPNSAAPGTPIGNPSRGIEHQRRRRIERARRMVLRVSLAIPFIHSLLPDNFELRENGRANLFPCGTSGARTALDRRRCCAVLPVDRQLSVEGLEGTVAETFHRAGNARTSPRRERIGRIRRNVYATGTY